MAKGKLEYDYKRMTIKAALDLGYDKCYLDRIRAAKTHDEISGIMTEARHAQMKNINRKSETYKRL